MTCVHLKKLYDLCQNHELKLAGSDLIHIICHECGEKEVCPSGLMDELKDDEADEANEDSAEDADPDS
jgi:hypothetical protein